MNYLFSDGLILRPLYKITLINALLLVRYSSMRLTDVCTCCDIITMAIFLT